MESDDFYKGRRTKIYSMPVHVRHAITRLEIWLDIDWTRDADLFSDFSFAVFASLKRVEVILCSLTCLFRAGPPYYGNAKGPSLPHDAQPIEINGLMNNPLIEWLSNIRGLEEFVLNGDLLSPCCTSVGGHEAVRALEKEMRAVVTKSGVSQGKKRNSGEFDLADSSGWALCAINENDHSVLVSCVSIIPP